jgi:tetratricopeptide (TPR) repeat protein
MAHKEDTTPAVSQEDAAQVQRLLRQFHKVANNLHTSTSQNEAETALADVINLPEAAQLALLKALSKERDADAADMLLAINELSPDKAIRKEARRSLIRLQEAHIYPKWNPPIDRTLAIQASANPPRFWKGVVTNTFDSGEAQLLLCWEQGEEYSQARILGFLLEFWHDGVKDFFTEVASKRHIETHIAEMQASAPDLETTECTLAEGRRLIQDALDINKRYGTIPHRDYRNNLSLVKHLVLDATDVGEDRGIGSTGRGMTSQEVVTTREMTPQGVVTSFVESLTSDDYGLAYDLLTDESSIREGLSRKAWIEHRRAWAEEADPANFKPEFIRELEQKEGGIWLPNRLKESQSSTRKQFDTGWSIEINDTPLSEGIKELPMGTAVNTVTQRHWFWTRYTLVKVEDAWRIESMTDEGANAQSLPVAELQKRVAEHYKQVDRITKKRKPTDPDAPRYLQEILWHLGQGLHYTDALIVKSPSDYAAYENAAQYLLALNHLERAVVYFEALVQRFPAKKNENLLQLAAMQWQLGNSLLEEGEDEASARYKQLAETHARESLALDNNYMGHILMSQLLKDNAERLDEAEDHLNQAKALNTSELVEIAVENDLGEIAMGREQYDQALQHFQRAAELDPNFAESWYNVAEAYNMLENVEEAAANYRHAIQLEPDDIDYYSALSRMYMEHEQLARSQEVLEEGLRANPDSAELRAFLALVMSESGDYRAAEALLDEAERINPDLEMIEMFRMLLNVNKTRQLPATDKTGQLAGAKKTKQLPNPKRARNKARRK